MPREPGAPDDEQPADEEYEDIDLVEDDMPDKTEQLMEEVQEMRGETERLRRERQMQQLHKDLKQEKKEIAKQKRRLEHPYIYQAAHGIRMAGSAAAEKAAEGARAAIQGIKEKTASARSSRGGLEGFADLVSGGQGQERGPALSRPPGEQRRGILEQLAVGGRGGQGMRLRSEAAERGTGMTDTGRRMDVMDELAGVVGQRDSGGRRPPSAGAGSQPRLQQRRRRRDGFSELASIVDGGSESSGKGKKAAKSSGKEQMEWF